MTNTKILLPIYARILYARPSQTNNVPQDCTKNALKTHNYTTFAKLDLDSF